jgi:hypothetical protein
MKSVHSKGKPACRIRIKSVLIFSILAICVMKIYGQANPTAYIHKMQVKFRAAANDSLKIEALSELAHYYYDYLSEKNRADSISRIAVELAEDSYQPQLLLLAYNRYLEYNDLGLFYDRALRYGLEASKLSKLVNNPMLEWRSCSNLVEVYLSGYRFDKALGSSYHALALADAMENDELKAESYLLIGRSLEGNNQKIEAFRNYLNASGLAEKMRKPRLLRKCYSQLSNFYNFSKLFDKAIAYKLKEVEIIENQLPVDSIALMWTRYDLQSINVNSNNNSLSTKSMQEVLGFAIRNNHKRLKNYEISLVRSYLIEANKMNLLYDLYNRQYPDELTRLSKESPALYFRLKAYFSEEQNRPDSAGYYLMRAEELLQTEHNKIMLSKFFYRFGQFLDRQGQPVEAIEKLKKSYDLAKQASYFEYMLSASSSLEALYSKMGDYKNAYSYSSMNRSLADSVNLLSENDQLLRLEIDHETRQREHAAELEHAETLRSHNIQYMAITIIIITLFVLLMMLGSLKVPEWSIKMLGFFSFILFFEFIILIADHKIYEITANEPWKILLIKIGLIAFLLPFHHWIEKQVIQYLINHKLIDFSRISLMKMVKKHIHRVRQEPATK